MSIVPSATPDFRAEPGTIVVQGTRQNGRLIVTEATANGQRVTVVVDTGSQVTIGNEALRGRCSPASCSGSAQQVELEFGDRRARSPATICSSASSRSAELG